MRRSITAALSAGLLLLGLAVPVSAKPEASGPTCADINPNGVTANYTTETDGRTVSFLFELSVPSCKNVQYAGYAYDATGTTLLGSGSVAGDGATTNEIGVSFVLPDGPTDICVNAATESSGGGVFDRAPDAGTTFCVVLTLDAGGGLSKFG